MSVTCGFYNSNNHDRTYDAVQMSSIFDGIIKDGVFMSIGDKLMVKANSGLTLNVGSGRAWFNHTWTLNDADLLIRWEAVSGEEYPVDLDGNNVTPETVADRIDAVILRVNSENSVRNNFIGIKKGVPSTVSPEKPVLINTETVHEYALAYVTITHGMQEITQSNIENAIGTSATPFITGILETVNADALLAQWQTQYAEHIKTSDDTFDAFMSSKRRDFTNLYGLTEQECDDLIASVQASLNANQAAFDTWFANLKNQLTANQAANLQRQIDALKDGLDTLTLVHIAVSYSEDLVGANITATNEDGTESYTVVAPADGVVIFDGMSLGTWTVTEDLYETSSEVHTVFYGNYHTRVGGGVYITVKYPEELDGENITVSKGSTMITKLGTSDLETLFVVASYGIWNVYAEYNGEPITAQIACYNDGEYEVELTLSKWGYRQWLDSAGITETFSSLEEVLADEKTVRTLMTKHAAVEYAIEWFENVPNDAETVFQNNICAKWITLRDYALDTFYANEKCKAAMDEADKYNYGEWTLVEGVTTLTNITPAIFAGQFASSEYSTSNAAWLAFDGNISTGWASKIGDVVGSYIGFTFQQPEIVGAVRILPQSTNRPEKFKIQGSNDKKTWDDVSETFTCLVDDSTYHFTNNKRYTSYRIYIESYHGSSNNVNIKEVQFYVWQPKGLVPKMTSKTEPYCTVITNSDANAYYVFDESVITNGGTANAIGNYVGIEFANPCKVNMLTFASYSFVNNNPNTYLIKGSVDNINWVDIKNFADSTQIGTVKFKNDNYYKYYRVTQLTKAHASDTYNTWYDMQFYGRELKVSVPKMTSNTAPWGEVSAISSLTGATQQPWYAFLDNPSATSAGNCWHSNALNGANAYLGYDFGYPVSVRFIKCGKATNIPSRYWDNAEFQGSNDGTNWEKIFGGITYDGTTNMQYYTCDNPKAYRYYRIYGKSKESYLNIQGTNFYGLDYSEHEERDYIYDHGVELQSLEKTKLPITMGNDSIYLDNLSTTDWCAIRAPEQDITKYKRMRVSIGKRYLPGTYTSLMMSPTSTGGSAVPNGIPYNNYLDVSSINGNYYPMVQAYSGSTARTYIDISEWWLE